jgi:hypothetical protein
LSVRAVVVVAVPVSRAACAAMRGTAARSAAAAWRRDMELSFGSPRLELFLSLSGGGGGWMVKEG